MNGFLGTSATFLSDLTLVLVFVFGVFAIGGAIQARRRKFTKHCPVMAAAALLNWIPVLLVMIPTWIELVQTQGVFSEISILTPIFHGILGAFTQILMTYTIVRMYWVYRLPPKKPLWLMRVTLILWVMTLAGGSLVYYVRYVI